MTRSTEELLNLAWPEEVALFVLIGGQLLSCLELL
jgi:hypothetical protein